MAEAALIVALLLPPIFFIYFILFHFYPGFPKAVYEPA